MNLQLIGLIQKIDSTTREELISLLEKDPQAAVARFVEVAASHGVVCDPQEIMSTLGLPPLAELNPEQLKKIVEGVRSRLKMLSLLGSFK